jgi:GAF domain-containing protein
MSDTQAVLRLEELAGFLSQRDDLKQCLSEAVASIRAALNACGCAVWLYAAESGATQLVWLAGSGDGSAPPPAADELATEAARSGTPLLIEDIDASEWRDRVPRPSSAGRGAIYIPLKLNGRVLGVLQLSGPNDDACFDTQDLRIAQVVAALLAKAVQAAQLHKILDSRFAQIALAESDGRHAGIMEKSMAPEKAAHIIAKSLFAQMTRAGFTDKQIIRTASEILEELSVSKRKGTEKD